jgi:hypothetical protein
MSALFIVSFLTLESSAQNLKSWFKMQQKTQCIDLDCAGLTPLSHDATRRAGTKRGHVHALQIVTQPKNDGGMVCLNGAPSTASACLNGKPPSSRDGARRSIPNHATSK